MASHHLSNRNTVLKSCFIEPHELSAMALLGVSLAISYIKSNQNRTLEVPFLGLLMTVKGTEVPRHNPHALVLCGPRSGFSFDF